MEQIEKPMGTEWYNKAKGIYITRVEDRTEEWHKLRMQGIGGSDCGRVLGLSDYEGSSVIELFYEKIGYKPASLSDNNYMLMGRILEDVVANLWQYYSGSMESVVANMGTDSIQRKCRNVNGVAGNIKYPHLYYNIDRLIEKNSFNLIDASIMEDNAILEIKTASSWVAKKWETGVPPQYVAQVTQGCMIFDVPYGEIAILELDSRTLKVYPIEPPKDFIEQIDVNTKAFWFDMVLPARELYQKALEAIKSGDMSLHEELMTHIGNYEPDSDSSESYKVFMNERWDSEPITIPATKDIVLVAKELNTLKETAKRVDTMQRGCENKIRQFMEENDTIDFGDDGKITWKTGSRGRVLRTASYKFDRAEVLADELNNLITEKIKNEIR